MLAVRSYRDRPIPADQVRRILEAAHLTASSRNAQPWHFIAIQDRATLEKLGAMARSGSYVAGAALAVVLASEPSPYGVSDLSRAAQSMMLTAWEAAIGSNWIGFGNLEALKDLLGIPRDFDVLGILSFGYPVQAIGKGRKKRKPFNDVVHSERYGQPFE
jgi:nitroreductase